LLKIALNCSGLLAGGSLFVGWLVGLSARLMSWRLGSVRLRLAVSPMVDGLPLTSLAACCLLSCPDNFGAPLFLFL